jgi:hypothetical protein
MKELAVALDRKQSILDQAAIQTINDYNFTETVEVKHRHKVGPFWKDPTYSYHDEWRFRHDKYHEDLSGVNAEITKCLSKISQLSNVLTSFKSKEHETNESLVEESRLEQSLLDTQTQLANVKAHLTSCVNNLNDTQRACILASEFDNNGAIFLLETICEKSFDPNILATIAIEQSKMNLLNFAITSGANLDDCSIRKQTLVQYAVTQGNQVIIDKVIASTNNFDNSLLSALSKNDLTTINAILSSYPQLASHLLAGESTVLHYAIANQQLDIIKYILTNHPESLNTLNDNGDSSLDIVKRTNNTDFIKYIAAQFNKEVVQNSLAIVGAEILDHVISEEVENSSAYDPTEKVEASGVVNNNDLDLM